jgi:C-22 sterol desaturase
LMIGKASMMLDWNHKVTDKSEVIKVFATIFPMVSHFTCQPLSSHH